MSLGQPPRSTYSTAIVGPSSPAHETLQMTHLRPRYSSTEQSICYRVTKYTMSCVAPLSIVFLLVPVPAPIAAAILPYEARCCRRKCSMATWRVATVCSLATIIFQQRGTCIRAMGVFLDNLSMDSSLLQALGGAGPVRDLRVNAICLEIYRRTR